MTNCYKPFIIAAVRLIPLSKVAVLLCTSMQVGTGYTMSELKDLGLKLKPYWKKFDTKRPPECVLLAKGFKVKYVQYYNIALSIRI